MKIEKKTILSTPNRQYDGHIYPEQGHGGLFWPLLRFECTPMPLKKLDKTHAHLTGLFTFPDFLPITGLIKGQLDKKPKK